MGTSDYSGCGEFHEAQLAGDRVDADGGVLAPPGHITEYDAFKKESPMAQPNPATATLEKTNAILAFHGVRYQVADVARAVEFYTRHLGFELKHQQLPAFANVSLGGAAILLSGPGASGSRPMPDGRPQQPGGWNRVVLRVNHLPELIESLKKAGLHFRNQMEVGPGGRQIQLEDPDGNPVELFEPAESR